jgi:uncharacterized membrane protein YhhN
MSTIPVLLTLLVLNVVALIRAELREIRRQIFVFKPLATLLVTAVAFVCLQAVPAGQRGYGLGILTALALSLAGDVALMFKARPAFLSGLFLFLSAHVVYAISFTMGSAPTAADLYSAAVLLLIGGVFFISLRLRTMRVPVIVYLLVISVMLNRACATVHGGLFASRQAVLIITGAVLFYLSDMVVAWARFKNAFKYNRLSLALYYGGQLCLALSVAGANAAD